MTKLMDAIEWVAQEHRNDPSVRLMDLADKASFRLDLSPKEHDALLQWCRTHQG